MSEQDKQAGDKNTLKKEATKKNYDRYLHDPVTLYKQLIEDFRSLERENRRLERQLRNYDDGENYWVNKRSFLCILIITAFMLVVSIISVVITLIYKTNQFDFLLYILSFAIIAFSLLIVAYRIMLRKTLKI